MQHRDHFCSFPPRHDIGTESIRVLVVDDEPTIADSMSQILRVRGCEVRTAYCGEDALVIAEEFYPQAVVSDVLMPGMSGVDLAVWLEAHQPNCRVLLMSGNQAGFGMVEDASARGIYYTILAKPVYPLEVFAFLANGVAAA